MNTETRKVTREHLVKANFAVHEGDADTALQNIEAARELVRLHCLKPPSLFVHGDMEGKWIEKPE